MKKNRKFVFGINKKKKNSESTVTKDVLITYVLLKYI